MKISMETALPIIKIVAAVAVGALGATGAQHIGNSTSAPAAKPVAAAPPVKLECPKLEVKCIVPKPDPIKVELVPRR